MIENRDDTINEIDLQKLIVAVLDRLKFIVITTIAFGVIFGLVSIFLIRTIRMQCHRIWMQAI